MIRLIVILACVLFFSVYAEAEEIIEKPIQDGHVYDFEEVLTEETEIKLDEIAKAMQKSKKMELLFLTLSSTGSLSPSKFGSELVAQWGGNKVRQDEMMIVFVTTSPPNRTATIATGAVLDVDYPGPLKRELIATQMEKALMDEEYDRAFIQIAQAISLHEGIDLELNEIGFTLNSNSREVKDDRSLVSVVLSGILAFFMIFFILILIMFGRGFIPIAFRSLRKLVYSGIKKIFKRDI